MWSDSNPTLTMGDPYISGMAPRMSANETFNFSVRAFRDSYETTNFNTRAFTITILRDPTCISPNLGNVCT